MARDNDKEDNDKSRGKMTVEEAGRKGGEAVREKYGEEFYQEIGKKGGEKGGNAVVDKYGPEHMAEIGRKGGEAQHNERGLEAADEQTRERVARAGGQAPHEQRGRGEDNDNSGNNNDGNNERGSDKRGFASMPEDKRKEIAKKGGESSHSGGRKD